MMLTKEQERELEDLKEDVILGRHTTQRMFERICYLEDLKEKR